MANKLYDEADIQAIADAIRVKNGLSTTYKVSEMDAAIAAISTGITPAGSTNITANGTYDVTNYASAIVAVSSGGGIVLPSNIQSGTITLSAATTTAQTITHGCGSAPTAVFVLADFVSTPMTYATLGGFLTNTFCAGLTRTNTGAFLMSLSQTTIANVGATTFDFQPRGETYPLKNGTYRWFAWT
jgi:hypothetical protein